MNGVFALLASIPRVSAVTSMHFVMSFSRVCAEVRFGGILVVGNLFARYGGFYPMLWWEVSFSFAAIPVLISHAGFI
jgi:hypothetical protein